MSLGMLARVNIKAIRGGVPAIVIGEIVGHRPPNDLNGEAFDVMLPPGCCAAQQLIRSKQSKSGCATVT